MESEVETLEFPPNFLGIGLGLISGLLNLVRTRTQSINVGFLIRGRKRGLTTKLSLEKSQWENIKES